MFKNVTPIIICGLFLIGIIAPLKAGNIEIAPFYGYRFGGTLTDTQSGQSVQVEPSAGAGGMVSIPMPYSYTDHLELLYSHQASSLSGNILNSDVQVRIDEWQLGISREFDYEANNTVKPFLVGLLGFSDIEFSDDISDEALFSVGLGGGVKYIPWKNVGFRLDARGFVSFVEGNGSMVVFGGASVVHFSGSVFIQGEIAPSLVILF
jgi:hypothetical protein